MTQEAHEQKRRRYRNPLGCDALSTPVLTEGFTESPNSTALVFLGVLAAFCISLIIVVFVMYNKITDKFVEKLAQKLTIHLQGQA